MEMVVFVVGVWWFICQRSLTFSFFVIASRFLVRQSHNVGARFNFSFLLYIAFALLASRFSLLVQRISNQKKRHPEQLALSGSRIILIACAPF